LELKASGLRGNDSFFNIVSKVLEIEVPYLLAIGKVTGAQMSEIVADREQRSVESRRVMSGLMSGFRHVFAAIIWVLGSIP
jgi:hypothetical protein